MTRIGFAGLELTLDADRVWHVTQDNGKAAVVGKSIAAFVNLEYGSSWAPAFGVYEPSLRNASAQAIAAELAAEILELDPIDEAAEGVPQ